MARGPVAMIFVKSWAGVSVKEAEVLCPLCWALAFGKSKLCASPKVLRGGLARPGQSEV